MCRWKAYVGEPLVIGELLYRARHGLIDESLHARMGAETTNGDGFGVGWYGARERVVPARYRSVNAAWNDLNLRELADHLESPLFMAHIRAAVGSPVQQTNCHLFRYGRWLFVQNGLIQGFQTVRRELLLAVDQSLFLGIADPPTRSSSSTWRSRSDSKRIRWAQWSGRSPTSSRRPASARSRAPCK